VTAPVRFRSRLQAPPLWFSPFPGRHISLPLWHLTVVSLIWVCLDSGTVQCQIGPSLRMTDWTTSSVPANLGKDVQIPWSPRSPVSDRFLYVKECSSTVGTGELTTWERCCSEGLMWMACWNNRHVFACMLPCIVHLPAPN